MPEDTLISVDCEASGPYPGRHALLSVGAVAVYRSGAEWKRGKTFYQEWAPPATAESDPQAMAVHGLTFASLHEKGADPIAGAIEFAQWVGEFPERRIFVGYNVAFDWAFVLHAFGAAQVTNPFHHAPLDIKSAIWGAHGGNWRKGSNTQALESLIHRKIETDPSARPHHALDDAAAQADTLIALLNFLHSR